MSAYVFASEVRSHPAIESICCVGPLLPAVILFAVGLGWRSDRWLMLIDAAGTLGFSCGLEAATRGTAGGLFATNLTWSLISGLYGALLGAVLGEHVSVRRARRRAHLECTECGCDLTGNTSGICPECGAPINADSRAG